MKNSTSTVSNTTLLETIITQREYLYSLRFDFKLTASQKTYLDNKIDYYTNKISLIMSKLYAHQLRDVADNLYSLESKRPYIEVGIASIRATH